jgi:sugar lactone lactonase YvrE
VPIQFKKLGLILFFVLFVAACSNGTPDADSGQSPGSPAYRVETLVAGGPMHGAKGITFGPDGMLYVCSVYSQSIYRVDVETGEVTIAVGAPDGESDDVAFAPDGTMAWTALASGEIRARRPGGEVFVIAKDLPLINPLAYTADGRLFAAQIGYDRVLEIDVSGNDEPRLVAKKIGNLNSFEITDEDELYGPLAGIGTLARIDINSGAVTPVAENLGMLSAVNLDSRGRIYAVGWSSGELLRIDADTGAAEVIAVLGAPLDNLAIGPDDTIYLSQPWRGAIVRVDPDTGQQTDIVAGNMSVPGGLAITTEQGRETLIMADDFAFRWVDTQTGEVWATVDLAEFMDPPAATDVAVNDEVIVLSDVSRSRVYMLDRATSKKLQQWKNIGAPYGLVLLDSGDPIVADYESGQLIKLSRADRKSRDVVAEGLSGPVGVTWAGPDALYVTEATAGRVSRINIEDGRKVVVSAGLRQPEGLAVLPDGRLAVVEVGARRVIAVNPETGATQVLAEDLPVGQFVPEAPAPVHVPSGIAVGANGILYLSSDRDHSVLKLVKVGE